MGEIDIETAYGREQAKLTLVALWNDLKVVHDAAGDLSARLRQRRYETATAAGDGSLNARLRAIGAALDRAREEANTLRGRLFEELGNY